MSAHGSGCTCGCCEGPQDRTPLHVTHRPGLDRLPYRIGTYPEFRASMIAGLTRASRPALRELTTRDPDDVAIGLLDAWAVTADVLTFYTERLAQESFLRTARDRTSLQELGRLIGYQLRPGVAAETLLAFAAEPAPAPPPQPPGTAAQPGSSPQVVPASVTVPVGLRVQSIPGPGEQPQTFETVESIDARPAWGAMPASTTVAGIGTTEAWLAGTATGLSIGDLVLFSDESASVDPVVRFVTAVSIDATRGRTRIGWSGALDGFPAGSEPTVTAFRKQLAVFGHNAPQWQAMSDDFQNSYVDGGSGMDDWPNIDIDLAADYLPLDGAHPDVVAGSKVIVQVGVCDDRFAVWDLTMSWQGSQAEFAVSGKVTHVIGATTTDLGLQSRRDIVVHAVSEVLPLTRRRDTTTVGGAVVALDVADVGDDLDDLAEGRRVIVTGSTPAGDAIVHESTLDTVSQSGGRWLLTLHDAIAADLDRSTVVINANVALATHGETVAELLGSGRASQAHQRFTLRQDPLTHRQSTDAGGATPQLEVRVNDVRWSEVATLYGAAADDRAYARRVDPDGHTYVQFGDGTSGSRLPTGDANVRARYRRGLGVPGNVAAGRLSTLMDRPLGLKGVANPSAATGGTDPEPVSAARTSIPHTTRTLGRAVSVLDYEDFALTFAGVSKATASVLPVRAGPTIVVTVAFGPDGLDAPGGRLAALSDSLHGHGDPHVLVTVVDHVQVPFRLALRVAVDPDRENEVVLTGVEAAVTAAFAFPVRTFGATVEASRVLAVAHSVPGVLAVDLDRLYVNPNLPHQHRLVAPAATVTASGAAAPAGVLVAAPSPFDWLEVMT